MLEHALEAMNAASGRKRDDLATDRIFFLVILKLVEIVGEAARRVTPATREATPTIPWSRIIGARDRLVHGYDTVDLDILWDTVTLDFPLLLDALRAVLEER